MADTSDHETSLVAITGESNDRLCTPGKPVQGTLRPGVCTIRGLHVGSQTERLLESYLLKRNVVYWDGPV